MAKKKYIHTYNSGDIVTFKFLTGDIYTGKITHQGYKQDGTPDYKIRVEDKKGFTIYPCMTDERIIKRDKTAKQALKDFNQNYRDTINKQNNSGGKKIKEKSSELDNAINAQKKFINGKS